MATRADVQTARSKGGKPRDANRIAGRTAAMDVYDNEDAQGSARASDGSTVERGPNGEVYRYNPKFDYTTIERDGNISAPQRGNQLPSGMNNYIDKVLEMSGMNTPEQGGAPANVPVPTARPQGGDANAGVPADGTAIPVPSARPEDAIADSNEATGGEALLALLGGGALGGVAKYAYDKVKSASPIDSMIDAIDGEPATPEQGASRVPEAAQIEGERRAALPAPQAKLAAPEPASAVDTMIDAVDGPPEQSALPAPPKQLTDADAPYSPRNPTSPGVEAATAPKSRMDVIKEAVGLPPRAMLDVFRQNGIDLNTLTDQERRMVAEAANALKASRQAAGDAVSSAVRGAMR